MARTRSNKPALESLEPRTLLTTPPYDAAYVALAAITPSDATGWQTIDSASDRRTARQPQRRFARRSGTTVAGGRDERTDSQCPGHGRCDDSRPVGGTPDQGGKPSAPGASDVRHGSLPSHRHHERHPDGAIPVADTWRQHQAEVHNKLRVARCPPAHHLPRNPDPARQAQARRGPAADATRYVEHDRDRERAHRNLPHDAPGRRDARHPVARPAQLRQSATRRRTSVPVPPWHRSWGKFPCNDSRKRKVIRFRERIASNWTPEPTLFTPQ
jgi:hypothetical protein